RLALWRRLGPRWAAPVGCIVAAAGAIALLAYRPTATDRPPWGDIEAGKLGDLVADPDILRVTPFVAASLLVGWREARDARRFRTAPEVKYREIEADPHPWYMSSLLLQALLILGTTLACITRVWTPPELVVPLLVTGLALCYSAVRVPFGNGYVASDGELEDE